MISVKNLRKSYRNKLVLNGLNFDVKKGSVFALLGENGAGKTTIVKILTTLLSADEGDIVIGGYNLSNDTSSIKKMISVTGQYSAVDELLTGEENLLMMGRLYHLDRKTVKLKTAELLQEFNLMEAAKQPVKTYSGGMRRRLDIAVSLLADPAIIFLDEPTTGLDPRSRINLWRFIERLTKGGVTIFLTTQYLEEADHLADKIALINKGNIVAEGSGDELKRIIGVEKLIFQFQGKEELVSAQSIVEGVVSIETCSISVTTAGAASIVRKLLNDLYEVGIEPIDIQFKKPTLEDVFLELTNKGAES